MNDFELTTAQIVSLADAGVYTETYINSVLYNLRLTNGKIKDINGCIRYFDRFAIVQDSVSRFLTLMCFAPIYHSRWMYNLRPLSLNDDLIVVNGDTPRLVFDAKGLTLEDAIKDFNRNNENEGIFITKLITIVNSQIEERNY